MTRHLNNYTYKRSLNKNCWIAGISPRLDPHAASAFIIFSIMSQDALIPCPGCGQLFPDIEGPNARYPGAAIPGCWAAFGEIIAKEFQDYRYGSLHRMTVDAYMLQHPGIEDPRTIQSVHVHLIALALFFDRGMQNDKVTHVLGRYSEKNKPDFYWLEPPVQRGDITVLDVVKAHTPEEHLQLVQDWARSVYEAWSDYHDVIFGWIDQEVWK